MLGVCLLYVGAVLINNGYCSLAGVDKKSSAVMKVFAGAIGIIIQTLNLVFGNLFWHIVKFGRVLKDFV